MKPRFTIMALLVVCLLVGVAGSALAAPAEGWRVARADHSDVATVHLTANAVNDPPVALDDTYGSTDEDTPLSVAAPGVLANDTDVESDPLTAELVSAPSHAASFTLNSDGSLDRKSVV